MRKVDLPGVNSPGEFDGVIHWGGGGGGGGPVTVLLSYLIGFLHKFPK